MASLYYAAGFNPHTEQTENLILESDCRWVAALAGFSLSIYQSAWTRVRLSVHCGVSINPSPANTRSNVWYSRWRCVIMCGSWGMASNKLPFFMCGFIHYLESGCNVNTYSHKMLKNRLWRIYIFRWHHSLLKSPPHMNHFYLWEFESFSPSCATSKSF